MVLELVWLPLKSFHHLVSKQLKKESSLMLCSFLCRYWVFSALSLFCLPHSWKPKKLWLKALTYLKRMLMLEIRQFITKILLMMTLSNTTIIAVVYSEIKSQRLMLIAPAVTMKRKSTSTQSSTRILNSFLPTSTALKKYSIYNLLTVRKLPAELLMRMEILLRTLLQRTSSSKKFQDFCNSFIKTRMFLTRT